MNTDQRPVVSKYPYFVNRMYGLAYWLKDYAYYPKKFPLFTYMDHGMTLLDTIPPHEVNNDAVLIFKFSPRLVEAYKKSSKKPVYNLMNPAIHYRAKYKIDKSPHAKGSIFFVGHSTPYIDDLTDWNEFIQRLREIPASFQPIDLCIHPSDIEKGLDQVFRKEGFNIVSASSDRYDVNFMPSFYAILRNYQYALSNIVGSYTFYAVEMGIPFSLYGDEPIYHNKGDRNAAFGVYEAFKFQEAYKKAKALFNGLYSSINEEQLAFVNSELGKYTSISRKKASFLLYKAYILYSLKHPKIFSPLKRIISNSIKGKNPSLHKTLKKYYTRIRS